MLRNDYFESVIFNNGKNFNVSQSVDLSYMNKLHWHPFVEILMNVGPEAEVDINFVRYPLGINDIVIVYPGDLHAIRNVASHDGILVIQFSNELFSILNDLQSNASLFSQYPLIKYAPMDPERERIVLLLKEFAALYSSSEHFVEVQMYALLLQFFEKYGNFCLREKKDATPDPAITGNKTTKKMAEACLYISQNCTNPLTLEDVSRHMGVTKSHFAHLFKQYTNMTFVDFLTEERIRRSEALFLDPSKQIIDIAFDSGFTSISSFNRSFKKIIGLTPTQYRETLINHLN